LKSHHLQIIYYNIYTSYNARSTRPLLPTALCLLTWRTSSLACGGEYPSTLVPGLLTFAPPFASPPTLSHPPYRSSYNVYIDDINNTSRPHLAQEYQPIREYQSISVPCLNGVCTYVHNPLGGWKRRWNMPPPTLSAQSCHNANHILIHGPLLKADTQYVVFEHWLYKQSILSDHVICHAESYLAEVKALLINHKYTGYQVARQEPGEVKLDLNFLPKARDQHSLNWKIQGHEERSVCDVSPHYRVCQFREHTQIYAAPAVNWKERENGHNWESANPCTLHGLGPETDFVLTCSVLNCGPQPGGTVLTLRCTVIAVTPSGKGGVSRVVPRPDFWQKYIRKYVKMSFLRSYQEFKKIWDTFLQE
jgi:hypothetical protein